MTPFEDLRARAAASPDDPALVGEERWTYGELLDSVQALAHALTGLGVGPGDRVTMSTANRPELVAGYYACFLLGAVACPLSTRLPVGDLASALRRFGPAAHLGEAGLEGMTAAAAEQAHADLPRVMIGDLHPGSPAYQWDDLAGLARSTALPDARVLDPEAPAMLISTTGTSGDPKVVVHTPATLGACVAAFTDSLTPGQTVALPAPPLLHISSLSSLLTFLRAGVPVALSRKPATGASVLDLVEAAGCSFVMGLPHLIDDMVAQQRARPRDTSSLLLAICGGDAPGISLQRDFEEVFGVPLHPIWGSTEAPGVLTYGLEEGQGSRVLPGARARVVERGDGASRDVPRGEPGELWLSAPSISPGYWAGPGRVEPLSSDGWFRTGDLFRAGERDVVRFVDRLKDLVVRGDEHVAPAEVEEVLAQHPAVTAATVLGVDRVDGRSALGQDIVALVTVQAEATAQVVEDVEAFAASHLADFKRPDRVRVVGELPRTALGKVDRAAARQLFST